MRKLINEEIAKEVEEKSVRLAIRCAKPSVKLLIKALELTVGKPAKAVGHGIKEKIHPTKGKMSVKTLIRKDQGVTSIPLAQEGLKDFEKIAKKYGVDFAVVKDKNEDPPIYTIFFKAKDQDAVTRILQDYAGKQLKEKSDIEKPSVLEKLRKFKEKVASIPRKVVEKKKERDR